ncbi:MAG: copper amine oxidase N-terminal domain-containing protein [Clostridiales Family XIII bacterium]|jgi:hypothetical protein|nr:copper amine oxidase N-terminal domain-containing protein [Clostridiales Family XIII bacterium]
MGGVLSGLLLCFIILNTITPAVAAESQTSALGYPVYVNGNIVKLNKAIIKDGRTYVQLRELCAQMNVTVDWVDPAYHMSPIPGGTLPEGINLTNPTFAYTAEVTNYYDTAQKINCVEITGIYQKYQTGDNLNYAFGDEGLVVKTDGAEKLIPLKYNPISGRMYLSVDEFREKVQPYLVDICMQER